METFRQILKMLREIRSYTPRDRVVAVSCLLALLVLTVLAGAGLIEALVFGKSGDDDSSLGPFFLGGMILIILFCGIAIVMLRPWARASRGNSSEDTAGQPGGSEQRDDVPNVNIHSDESGAVSPKVWMWLFVVASIASFFAGFAVHSDALGAGGFFLLVPAIVASAFAAKENPDGWLNRTYEWLNQQFERWTEPPR